MPLQADFQNHCQECSLPSHPRNWHMSQPQYCSDICRVNRMGGDAHMFVARLQVLSHCLQIILQADRARPKKKPSAWVGKKRINRIEASPTTGLLWPTSPPLSCSFWHLAAMVVFCFWEKWKNHRTLWSSENMLHVLIRCTPWNPCGAAKEQKPMTDEMGAHFVATANRLCGRAAGNCSVSWWKMACAIGTEWLVWPKPCMRPEVGPQRVNVVLRSPSFVRMPKVATP